MTDEEWGRWFAAHGPGVGEPMIDPELYDLDGNPVRLSLSWRERPAILVTASLTCPVARHQGRRSTTCFVPHAPVPTPAGYPRARLSTATKRIRSAPRRRTAKGANG